MAIADTPEVMVAGTVRVEIVLGLPDRQQLVCVDVSQGTSCASAIGQSGIGADFPDIDLGSNPIAIWGKPASRHDILKNGDRVEILRPLVSDPRDARRQRADKGQVMGGGRVKDAG